MGPRNAYRALVENVGFWTSLFLIKIGTRLNSGRKTFSAKPKGRSLASLQQKDKISGVKGNYLVGKKMQEDPSHNLQVMGYTSNPMQAKSKGKLANPSLKIRKNPGKKLRLGSAKTKLRNSVEDVPSKPIYLFIVTSYEHLF